MEGNFLLGEGESARGHEFHYSTFEPGAGIVPAYQTKGRFGSKQEGVLIQNLVAGYTHIHFASQPQFVKRWMEACLSFKKAQCTGSAYE
jgi:cobyrinic acid a,c-diamide synthase